MSRSILSDRQYLLIKLVSLVAIVAAGSCTHDPLLDPSSLNNGQPSTPGCVSSGQLCFESSVLPIFVSSCASKGCHDSKSRREGYTLDTYSNIVKRGITPGNANGSKLYKILFDGMPPGAPLSKAQKDSIATWINQGAKNTTNCNCSCDPNQFTFDAIIHPLITNNCTGCHKPGSLGGGIDLSSYQAINVAVGNGKLLGSVTHSGGYVSMPPGGSLSDCQISQIESWITAGSKNN